ncbi:hypothetical protein C2845_PM15G04480 [Panicum miliaceum]|uniref:Uncharacterized protein n=1 Tax=Panicum miliaceum TaxID=4540 RepID=A0A3L6Q8R0_PANMI|nr:hypothetical protein C2845_PM15G04480 [Panicum miliaceum]
MVVEARTAGMAAMRRAAEAGGMPRVSRRSCEHGVRVSWWSGGTRARRPASASARAHEWRIKWTVREAGLPPPAPRLAEVAPSASARSEGAREAGASLPMRRSTNCPKGGEATAAASVRPSCETLPRSRSRKARASEAPMKHLVAPGRGGGVILPFFDLSVFFSQSYAHPLAPAARGGVAGGVELWIGPWHTAGRRRCSKMSGGLTCS